MLPTPMLDPERMFLDYSPWPATLYYVPRDRYVVAFDVAERPRPNFKLITGDTPVRSVATKIVHVELRCVEWRNGDRRFIYYIGWEEHGRRIVTQYGYNMMLERFTRAVA